MNKFKQGELVECRDHARYTWVKSEYLCFADGKHWIRVSDMFAEVYHFVRKIESPRIKVTEVKHFGIGATELETDNKY